MIADRVKELLEPKASTKAKLTATAVTLGKAIDSLNARVLNAEVQKAEKGDQGKDGRDGRD
jgi:hypothetical protein